jgi:hypothetical protein
LEVFKSHPVNEQCAFYGSKGTGSQDPASPFARSEYRINVIYANQSMAIPVVSVFDDEIIIVLMFEVAPEPSPLLFGIRRNWMQVPNPFWVARAKRDNKFRIVQFHRTQSVNVASEAKIMAHTNSANAEQSQRGKSSRRGV